MPTTSASMKSRPLMGRCSAKARMAGTTGAAGWIAVCAWVSSKSNTWELIPFNSDACRMSTRSRRPNSDAWPGPQNGSKAAIALLTVSCPEPPIAHPTQLRRVRFASCLTGPGRSSKRDAIMNRASFRVASLEASGAEFTIAPLREAGKETIVLQLAALGVTIFHMSAIDVGSHLLGYLEVDEDNVKFPRRQILHLLTGAIALPAAPRFAMAQAYPNRP